MKEAQIKIEEKRQVKAEQKQESSQLIGSLQPKKGQFVFEYCIATGDMKKVEPEKLSIDFEAAKEGEIVKRSKVIVKKDHLYAVAINERNALRKILKRFV